MYQTSKLISTSAAIFLKLDAYLIDPMYYLPTAALPSSHAPEGPNRHDVEEYEGYEREDPSLKYVQ